MGQGYEVACVECGYIKIMFLGLGMIHGNPEFRERNLKKLSKTAKLFLETPGWKEVSYVTDELFECNRCNTIHVRKDFNITCDIQETFYPKFYCGKCRNKLIPAKKDLESYLCNKCGKGLFKIIGIIDWD